jgi:hypothetical protein
LIFFLQNSEAAEPEEAGKPEGKVVESKPREKGKLIMNEGSQKLEMTNLKLLDMGFRLHMVS